MSGIPSKRGRRIIAPSPSSLIALGTSSNQSSISTTSKRPIDATNRGDDFSARKRDFGSAFSTSESALETKMSKVHDLDAQKVASQIVKCCHEKDFPSLIPHLIDAIKFISNNRVSPNEALFSSVIFAFKDLQNTNLLESYPKLMKIVLDILKDVNWNCSSGVAKQRPNNAAVSLACNILYYSFRSSKESWPIQFVKLFIEDFVQERVWSDLNSQLTKDFVFNIIWAFKTEFLPGFTDSITPAVQRSRLFVSGPNLTAPMKDDSKISPIGSPVPFLVTSNNDANRVDRYPADSTKSLLCKLVIDVCNEVLSKGKSGGTSSTSTVNLSTAQNDNQQKSTLQLLTVTCGLPQIRSFACSKLEAWLHNTKLLRPAQDLLTSICINCSSQSALSTDSAAENEEIIATLIRVKPKNKLVGNLITSNLKDMCDSSVEMSKILIRNIVFNEFSVSYRNPNNMITITNLFQTNSLLVTTHLAYAFQLVLYQKEDFTKAVRVFFREIVKNQKGGELKFDQFCTQLLDIQPDVRHKMDENEAIPLTKYLLRIADVATYALYICLPINCRDLYSTRSKPEDKDFSILIETQSLVAQVLAHFVEWIKAHAPYFPSPEQYTALMQKMLLFEPLESYLRQDPYPPDQAVCHRILIESGVMESCLFNIVHMALLPEIPLTALAAMNFIEGLVTRSPLNVITIQKPQEFFNQLFKLALYSKPASISLPPNYQEPSFAVSNLLWKAWTVLVVLCGSNLETIASIGWDNYPMLKMLMEMALTSDFNYPPSASQVNRDELRRTEIRLQELERNEIIKFECHLAGKVITADSSLLISQLTFMDPKGPPRQPSHEYMTHLKLVCGSLKIGTALCSSRGDSNDFLLDVLKRNRTTIGSSNSPSWLSHIIMASEIVNLPPQCLCESLLMESQSTEVEIPGAISLNVFETNDKFQNIKSHLSRAIADTTEAGIEYSAKVVMYFLSALTASEDVAKKQLACGLILDLTKVALKDNTQTSKPETIYETIAKLDCVKQSVGDDLIRFALQTFAKDFDYNLIASSLKFIVSKIAVQAIEKRSFIINFADTFVNRYSTVIKSLSLCHDIVNLFPSCCRIIFGFFQSSKNQPCEDFEDSNWKILTVWRGTKVIAPMNVITCLYLMIFQTPDVNECLPTFPLKDLHFEVVQTILPKWAILQCALDCETLYLNWIEQMKSLDEILKCLEFIGVSESVVNALLARIEKFPLSEIKSCLKILKNSNQLQVPVHIVTKFGPKLECAYSTIFQNFLEQFRGQQTNDIVEEIDEYDVDVLEQGECNEAIKLSECTSAQVLSELIKQIITKHPRQNLTLSQVGSFYDDKADLNDSLCEVIKIHSVLEGLELNIPVHEFTGFIFQIAKNVSFRHLNKLFSTLQESLVNTKFTRSLKMLKIHVENEERSMEPKSPEPEAQLSLKSKSLLDYGAPKTGILTKRSFSRAGKVLDLVQITDPETIEKEKDYLWNVLFSGQHNFSSYHCFLMSNLIHNATWSSIQTTIDQVLSNLDTLEVSLNPTIVLDFITAVQLQPKLYQGRETSVLSKTRSCVLSFKVGVISKLLILMYQECLETVKTDKGYLALLQSRIVLLLKLLERDQFEDDVISLVKVCDTFKNERVRRSVQMLLYLNTAAPVPEVKDKLSSLKTDKFQNSFEMDILAYNLTLSVHSCSTSNHDNQNLVSALITKFATLHPTFANRQLDLLAILIKGRLRSSWTSFRRDGHTEFFRACVRVLLRLPQSSLGHKKFSEIVHTILETLQGFSSLTNEFYKKLRSDIFELVDRFFEYDHVLAKQTLLPFAQFLRETPKRNKFLLACLGAIDTDPTNQFPQTTASIQNAITANADLNRCRKLLTGSLFLDYCNEDILHHLRIVEDLSHRHEVGLESIVEPLLSLLSTSRSPDVCERVISILLSICKTLPSVSDQISDGFIEILSNYSNLSATQLQTILNTYSIDVLLVNCSDRGIRLAQAIFDACVFTNFADGQNQIKKMINAVTLEPILST